MKRVVVKIGSSTLVGKDGRLDRAFIGRLAIEAAALRDEGWQTVIVTSGSIDVAIKEAIDVKSILNMMSSKTLIRSFCGVLWL